jgi:cholest-4-en-3-one 26-monooxygenase
VRHSSFDDDVFDDPFRFNILRNPNPYRSFGGTSAHYCVGANLARLTVNLMFEALADTVQDLKALARRSGYGPAG